MNILIAMDASAASTAALEEISTRPWPAGTSFEIVTVVEPTHTWTTSEAVQSAAHAAQQTAEQAAASLCAKNLKAIAIVLYGDPKYQLRERARESHADFLITGSHGDSKSRRFILGSVASSLLRHAPCSIEIVRPRTSSAPARKILLATDGSDPSVLAARSLAARPWPSGTEVRVLSAVELIVPTGYALFEPPMIDTTVLEAARGQAMKHAQDSIAGAREILSAAGLPTSESISVLLDPPKTIILNEAAQWGADLIVVGSHGRRGIDRLLLGSTSEAVAGHADCSVEVIRAHQ